MFQQNYQFFGKTSPRECTLTLPNNRKIKMVIFTNRFSHMTVLHKAYFISNLREELASYHFLHLNFAANMTCAVSLTLGTEFDHQWY